MSEWSYAVIILTLIAFGAVVLWSRRTRTAERPRDGGAVGTPPRNYTQERETTRTGALSPDDQAWEAERIQRDQAADEENQPPAKGTEPL
jgi:hypothetical protein